MTNVKNYGPKYDCLKSSDEIIYAIEKLFGPFEFTDENEIDEDTQAYQVWVDPSDEQIKKVETLAWSVADLDEDQLWWGENEIDRPNAN